MDFITFVLMTIIVQDLGVIFKEVRCIVYIQKFKNELEKETRKSIKILKLDNGGEYFNCKFRKYDQDSGIRRQFSQAHALQHNGVFKRKK